MAGHYFMMRFAVLGAAILMLLLLRPACELLPTHATVAVDAAACCTSLSHGDAFETSDLAASGPSGNALPGPLAMAYLAGAALFVGTPLLLASGALRTRSFYARSARILR